MENTNFDNTEWLEWLAQVMPTRPKNNAYLDSERGMEIGQLCFQIEREDFAWRRSDPDVFWIDVQLFTKYQLTDDEIRFICSHQAGNENYKKHSAERNAYAEMMRGMNKLKEIEQEKKRKEQ